MAQIVNLTQKTFDETIKTGTVLVDFWADWCGPCRMLAPVLDELSEKLGDKAVFAKVNVDEERELAQRFGVSSIPTVIVFKNGVKKADAIGVKPARAYEQMITD
ncbi:MAG: thioredoxin [Clostridiales bacterium]|jgi:thioredoxin 1|nr:thioredoxin [Clostridiales bacterium]